MGKATENNDFMPGSGRLHCVLTTARSEQSATILFVMDHTTVPLCSTTSIELTPDQARELALAAAMEVSLVHTDGSTRSSLIVKDKGSRRAGANFAALSAELRAVLESDAGFKTAKTVRLQVYSTAATRTEAITECGNQKYTVLDLHADSITPDVLVRHCGTAIGFDSSEVALVVQSYLSSVQVSSGVHKANGGFGVGISTPASDGKPKRAMRGAIVKLVQQRLSARELATAIKDAFV